MARVARKVILFANTDWYLYNFRLPLAEHLREEGFEVVLVAPPGDYVEMIRDAGFRFKPVPMNRTSLNPFSELAVVLRFARILRRERPQVVHGFTLKCALYGALATRLSGVPACIGAVTGMGHVFTSDGLRARVLRPIVRTLLRSGLRSKGFRLILQNPDDVRLFQVGRIVPPRQIRLIRSSGVDCSQFRPANRSAQRNDVLRVILAARLLWDKGIAEYVEAARILRDEGRELEFLLAGRPDPGNPASVPERLVREWCEDGLLHWLGHVEGMAELLRTVDIMVLPSYREGVPRSLIEGAATGLALVTTDRPGCREVVTHEVDGLLVPARDAQALARAIARLEDDRQLARRLAAAARTRALSEFDQRAVFNLTRAVYEEVLPAPLSPPN